MARLIVKLRDLYLEWSTVVDAPVSTGMPLNEFRDYYIAEHGQDSIAFFESCIAKADASGASTDYNWRKNRAGPNETSLDENELYDFYCLGKPLDDLTERANHASLKQHSEEQDQLLPIPSRATRDSVRKSYGSLRLGMAYDAVSDAFGAGDNISRKRGPLRYQWAFDGIEIRCQFDRSSKTLVACELVQR